MFEVISETDDWPPQPQDLRGGGGPERARALGEDEADGAECFVLLETSGGKREHDEEVSPFS